MRIPANSLYFKLNGPDQTLTQNRPLRGGQSLTLGATNSSASNKARTKCRLKPFPLTRGDAYLLWGQIGLSHGVIKGRGYFSVPSTVKGALWLQHHGFTRDQIELGPFIGAPMLRADEEPFDLELADYVLIPTSKVWNSSGKQIHEVLPQRQHSKPAFDIHPICSRYLKDHQALYWTSTGANADNTVSRQSAAIALHGTYMGGVVPTAQELERLYRASNLDKLLLEHVFVLDSNESRTGVFFQTLEQLALVLPDVQVVQLKPWEDGSPVTLASIPRGADYMLNSCPWEDERWDEEPWGKSVSRTRPDAEPNYL